MGRSTTRVFWNFPHLDVYIYNNIAFIVTFRKLRLYPWFNFVNFFGVTGEFGIVNESNIRENLQKIVTTIKKYLK